MRKKQTECWGSVANKENMQSI